jgi:redox-sensing transcriptional repressor
VSMHSGSMQSGDRLGRRADPARQIPEATASRLLGYLRVLTEYPHGRTASSRNLAAAAGVDAAKLRRDLSFLGSYGVRGVGYDVATLIDEISRALGAHTAHRVALVGVGNLGHALAGYSGFAGHGFQLAALFDNDPHLVGTVAAGLPVHDIADLARILPSERVSIGIIATPGDAAQAVADSLIEAGVRSILNFAPCQLELGDDVNMRQVDLGLELQMLAFHEARRPPRLAGSASPERAVAR